MEALRADYADLKTASDQGIVLRAGETIQFLAYIRTSDNSPIWDAFETRLVHNLSIRYCYCSAFNDCWTINARLGVQRDLNPPRVRACLRPQVPYDNTPG